MVAELTALRDQIDDVDKALLNLLAKRLELVAKVGEVKSRFGLLFTCRSVRPLCWLHDGRKQKRSVSRPISLKMSCAG